MKKALFVLLLLLLLTAFPDFTGKRVTAFPGKP